MFVNIRLHTDIISEKNNNFSKMEITSILKFTKTEILLVSISRSFQCTRRSVANLENSDRDYKIKIQNRNHKLHQDAAKLAVISIHPSLHNIMNPQ